MIGKETPTGLPIVYAYQDEGVLVPGTRWEPRRVFCTGTARHLDPPGRLYVVKYRRSDAVSAAALISEVVGYGIFQAFGVRTFQAALVRLSPTMARRYARDAALGYQIPTGDHFGTLYRPDVVAAGPSPGTASFLEALAEPKQLIAIWAVDSWLMNLDREVYGNLVLGPNGDGKWHLIAADQSDCFLGSSALADGSYVERSRQHGAAAYLPFLEQAFLRLGAEPLREIVTQIEEAAGVISEAASQVPTEWWREANVSSRAVVHCLEERAGRIREIVQIEHWEGLSGATQGGFLLGG